MGNQIIGLQCDASWHHNIVRIEGGHELAAGQIQPPIQRSTHPLIRLANEFHSMHRRITSPATQRLLDTQCTVVGRAIVDHNELNGGIILFKNAA